jgi:hypothetical protein
MVCIGESLDFLNHLAREGLFFLSRVRFREPTSAGQRLCPEAVDVSLPPISLRCTPIPANLPGLPRGLGYLEWSSQALGNQQDSGLSYGVLTRGHSATAKIHPMRAKPNKRKAASPPIRTRMGNDVH